MIFLNSLRHALTPGTIGTGFVAALLACTGPSLIVISAAHNGHLSAVETVSWLFGIYVMGGLIGMYMSLRYSMPISGAYSIPSAVLMTTAITQFSFQEAVGSYLLAGVLIITIALLGLFDKMMRWLPSEIVMAMIAGSMIQFGTGIVDATKQLPLIGFLCILSYIIFSRWLRKIPAVIGVLLIGLVFCLLTGKLQTENLDLTFQFPALVYPSFSFHSFLAISVPIFLLLLGTEASQGITVLKQAGYKPP